MPGGRYPWAVRAGGPLLRGGGGAVPTLFTWNPEFVQALPGTSTATRTSIAKALTTATDTVVNVWLIAGQSNVLDGATVTASDQQTKQGVFQLANQAPNIDKIIPASEALQHPDFRSTKIGFGFVFAKIYKTNNSSESIVLVPSGEGASGFVNNEWNQGDPAYDLAVSQTNKVLVALPEATFAGVLWLQGEQDSAAGTTEVAYANSLDTMIASMRSDILRASSSVWLTGQLPEQFVAVDPVVRSPVQAAITDTPNRITNCALVSSSGLNAPDDLHFDAASQRTLGQRYYDALLTI